MDWPEGYKLAEDCKFKFPTFKPVNLKTIIPNASDDAIRLMADMLNWCPYKRPSGSKCLNDVYFRCTLPIPLKIVQSNGEEVIESKGSVQAMSSEHAKYVSEERSEEKQERSMLTILLNARYKPGKSVSKNI